MKTFHFQKTMARKRPIAPKKNGYKLPKMVQIDVSVQDCVKQPTIAGQNVCPKNGQEDEKWPKVAKKKPKMVKKIRKQPYTPHLWPIFCQSGVHPPPCLRATPTGWKTRRTLDVLAGCWTRGGVLSRLPILPMYHLLQIINHPED